MKRWSFEMSELGELPFKEFSTRDLIPLSTSSSSKGNQVKYRTVDQRYYVKEQFQYGCFWQDNLVETIASRYAALCNLPSSVSVVKQGLCLVDGRQASYSEAFDMHGEKYISFRRACSTILGLYDLPVGLPEDTFREVVSICTTILGVDALPYVCTMCLLDLIVCNEDRHYNNFGFLQGLDEGISLTPLFDFGQGLFETGVEYNEAKDSGVIPTVRLKPFWFTQEQLLDFLLDEYGNVCLDILPSRICLSDYTFPSELAKTYFAEMNRRLGVKVEI